MLIVTDSDVYFGFFQKQIQEISFGYFPTFFNFFEQALKSAIGYLNARLT